MDGCYLLFYTKSTIAVAIKVTETAIQIYIQNKLTYPNNPTGSKDTWLKPQGEVNNKQIASVIPGLDLFRVRVLYVWIRTFVLGEVSAEDFAIITKFLRFSEFTFTIFNGIWL